MPGFGPLLRRGLPDSCPTTLSTPLHDILRRQRSEGELVSFGPLALVAALTCHILSFESLRNLLSPEENGGLTVNLGESLKIWEECWK